MKLGSSLVCSRIVARCRPQSSGAIRYVSTAFPDRKSTVAKFSFPSTTHTIRNIDAKVEEFVRNKDKKVTINGHLHRKPRVMTTKSFAELRDENGDLTQVVMSPEVTKDIFFAMLKSGLPEDCVSITGYVQEKQARPGDEKLQWELVVENYQVLNKSNLDATRLDKLKHNSPADLPPQFRYLQLRSNYYQNALRTRSKVSSVVRRVLGEKHDFVEIETPLLFKSTPEGAREFLVPTRTNNKFYALPQSPQQYKQMLMSSGFTKYYQLAKCFRDEDLRADRQPEFTQIDLEMSFVNTSKQVMSVVEDIIHNVWTEIKGYNTYKVNEDGYLVKVEYLGETGVEFPCLNYIDALTQFGIDKPDLRSSLKFNSLQNYFKPCKNLDFPVLEVCVLKNAFDASKKYKIPKLLTEAGNYLKRKPIVLQIKTEEDANSWYEKLVQKGYMELQENFSQSELYKELNVKPGDILALSTRAEFPYENPTPLGRFRQLAIQEYPNNWKRPIYDRVTKDITTNYDLKDVFVGSWVVDFPLFNPVEVSVPGGDFPTYDFSKYESTHHPFTMVKLEDYELLKTDPLKVKGEHYDLVINGVEVGGGSRRIHDPDFQQYIFEEILCISNFNELFGHLLKCLSMGCPPHAGLAIGFDRLCTMLIGSNSIRDVVAFPKNQSGIDPVVESPTGVAQKVLDQYHITTINKM